jgi:serine/threonine protein kinase
MVMDFCAGGDLSNYLLSDPFQAPGEFSRVVLEMLSGVAYLHAKNIAQ